MMFGKKGQAFDTFKLMIAAVIAVAILGILLGIIGGIGQTITQQPVEVAKGIINSALDAPCAPIPSGEVSFQRNDGGWVAETFSVSSGYKINDFEIRLDSSVGSLMGSTTLMATADFPGGMTAVCDSSGDCIITIYTASASSPTVNKPGGC